MKKSLLAAFLIVIAFSGCSREKAQQTREQQDAPNIRQTLKELKAK